MQIQRRSGMTLVHPTLVIAERGNRFGGLGVEGQVGGGGGVEMVGDGEQCRWRTDGHLAGFIDNERAPKS